MPRPKERMKCAVCNHVLNYTEEYADGELQGGNWTHAQEELNDHPTVAVPLDEGGAATVMCDFCGSEDGEVCWLECEPFAVQHPRHPDQTVMDDGKWSMCQGCRAAWNPWTIEPLLDRASQMHQDKYGYDTATAEVNRNFILKPIYESIRQNFIAFRAPEEE